MHRKINFKIICMQRLEDRKKMTLCRWQRQTRENDKKYLLKFNLDQNDFVTYRNEAGLTFNIIMLNSLTLIHIMINWYNHKKNERHNFTIPNEHRDILLRPWRIMIILGARVRRKVSVVFLFKFSWCIL